MELEWQPTIYNSNTFATVVLSCHCLLQGMSNESRNALVPPALLDAEYTILYLTRI